MQFGGLKALNDVDLAVKRGTIHGLIGPNGSGKSTMMNVLTGIYVPTAGTIDFDGKSLVGADFAEDRAVGHRAHVPERAALRRDDRAARTSWSACTTRSRRTSSTSA